MSYQATICWGFILRPSYQGVGTKGFVCGRIRSAIDLGFHSLGFTLLGCYCGLPGFAPVDILGSDSFPLQSCVSRASKLPYHEARARAIQKSLSGPPLLVQRASAQSCFLGKGAAVNFMSPALPDLPTRLARIASHRVNSRFDKWLYGALCAPFLWRWLGSRKPF